MRIGIFNGGSIPNPTAGGGATFQSSLLSALGKTESPHSFYFFCDGPTTQNLYPNLTVRPIRRFFSSPHDALLKKLCFKGLRLVDAWLCKRKYKSFLQRAARENALDILWFLSPVYQYVDIPYVFTVWDLQHRLQPYFPEVSVTGSTYEDRERIYAAVIPQASYIVIGNEAGKKEIVQFYGVPEWRIKINPLPTPQFALMDHNLPTQQKTSTPYLFYPAQFWPHKNHVVILHAIKLLQSKFGLDFDVVFTGSDKGNLAYIQEVVVQLGLENRVRFLGFVDQPKLITLYQNAFALVFASFFGPDNIPPLEAFGLGCPVIASRVSGAEYQLEGAALLFDPASEADLAEKIILLQQNQTIRQKLIKEGKSRAECASSDNYITTMLKIFDGFAPIRRCWSSKIPYKHL